MASAPTFPPGGTIVQVLKRSFKDVPVDAANGNAISTSEFLEAAESLTTIFGTATPLLWIPASLQARLLT